MTIDITEIVKAVVELVVGIAGIFLIPWLKQKIGNEKLAKIVVPKGASKKFSEQLPFFADIITENEDDINI